VNLEILGTYEFWKLTVGAISTIALFSVLYRENMLYRVFEHIFLGLAAGWAIVALWSETLKPTWWDNMMGVAANSAAGETGRPGYFLYAALPAIGLMAYFVFSKKYGWMSRIPIGILLGLAAGQEFEAFQQRFLPQVADSMLPLLPTTTERWGVPPIDGLTPEQIAAINAQVYPSEAINNFIFVATILAALSYFIFSVDLKGRFATGMTTTGRWLLMIGFGAIFGSTVAMRFTLLIDRLYVVAIEWFRGEVLRVFGL
jgi:hypothetical protein